MSHISHALGQNRQSARLGAAFNSYELECGLQFIDLKRGIYDYN